MTKITIDASNRWFVFLSATLVAIAQSALAQATVTPAPGTHVSAPTAAAPAAAPGAPGAAVTGTQVNAGSTVTTDGPGTATTNPGPGSKVTTTAAPGSTTTTTQQAPNGVEVEVGVVSRLNGAISSYQANSGVLSLSNLGRSTPQLLTGLGFSCDTSTTTTTAASATGSTVTSTLKNSDQNSFCKSHAKHLGAYISVQVGSGTSQTISGYSIGMTYAVNKYMRVLAGFSLSPSSEISPGFANAAAQYVTKNPTLFPGVNPANLASNAYGAFDGIQFTMTAPAAGASPTSTIYYPGSTTETRYRGGFIVGIALPINIYNLLGGNSKSQ